MKAAVQYSKLPAAVFCSVTPTVQKETQQEKVLSFFHFMKRYSQKQEKKKTIRYMPYAIAYV